MFFFIVLDVKGQKRIGNLTLESQNAEKNTAFWTSGVKFPRFLWGIPHDGRKIALRKHFLIGFPLGIFRLSKLSFSSQITVGLLGKSVWEGCPEGVPESSWTVFFSIP